MPQAQYMQLLEHNLPTVCQWLNSFGFSYQVVDDHLAIALGEGDDAETADVPLGKFVCLRTDPREIWVADEAPPIEEENQQVPEVSGQP